MSKRDWIEVTTSLIGGAGIGAGLMYLFDPDRGEDRREHLREQAANAASATGEALGSSWQTVAQTARGIGSTVGEYGGAAMDKAKDWGGTIADSAKSAGRYVADRASHYTSSAGSAASDAGDWLSDAGDSARGYGRRAAKSARSFAGYDRGPSAGSVVGVTAGVVGALALGAGLMFLLDPAQGRRRRALVRDKAGRYTRETARYAQSTGRYMADKAKGMAHNVGDMAQQVGSKITGSGPSKAGDALAETVRSQIGRLGADFKAVSVRADGGRIVMTGNLPGSRVDELLSKIRGITGVEGIDNQLKVQSTVL